jgi:hypothetical protein
VTTFKCLPIAIRACLRSIADVVDFEGCAVLYRAPNSIVAEVAFLHAIPFRTEIAMRILHRSVDRCAGETKAEAICELYAHGHRITFGASALLRAMRLGLLIGIIVNSAGGTSPLLGLPIGLKDHAHFALVPFFERLIHKTPGNKREMVPLIDLCNFVSV